MLKNEPEMEMGLSVSNVTVSYRNGHVALSDASFSLPSGTIAGLVGVNGSGKSTLFKAIMGFVPLAKGNISLLGISIKKALKKGIVAYVQTHFVVRVQTHKLVLSFRSEDELRVC
jgi:manganese/iron transport system ATP-binding protein